MTNLKLCHPVSNGPVRATLLVLALSVAAASAADFSVRTPNAQFAFQINGVDSPTLTLVRGQTYTFDVQTTVAFHPFHIESQYKDSAQRLRDRFSGRRHPPHRERRNSQMLPECDPSVLSDGLLTHLPSPFSAHCLMQVGSPTLAGAQLQL